MIAFPLSANFVCQKSKCLGKNLFPVLFFVCLLLCVQCTLYCTVKFNEAQCSVLKCILQHCTGWGTSWRQNCQMGQVVGGGSQTSGAQAALVSLSQKIWTPTGQEGSQARGLARTWTCIYRPGDFNLLARELITAQPPSVVRSKKFLFLHILVMMLLSQFRDNFCSYLDPAVKRSCHQMCRFE